MLSALRQEDKTGGFEVEDPREHTAVVCALENTNKLSVGRYEVMRREYGAFVKETGRKTADGCWVGDGSTQNRRLDAARS